MSTSAACCPEVVARAFVDAFNRRDADALIAVSDPDIEWQPSVLVGSRRTYRGHEGLRRWVEDLRGAVIQHRSEVRSVTVLDEHRFAVVCDVFIDGEFATAGAMVARFGGTGTIVEGRGYLTDAAMLRQLGIFGD